MIASKIHVYYDGLCKGCTAFATHIARSEKAGRFDLHNAAHDDLPGAITKDAAMKDIHVVDENGTYKGSAAIVKIMEQYPRWRWLAKLGRMPGFRHIVAGLYRLLADHRYWILGRKNVS